jgi:hypothetical protein
MYFNAIKNLFVFTLVLFLTGCATAPHRPPEISGVPLTPSAAPAYEKQVDKVENGSIYLKAESYQLSAIAKPVAKKLAMKLSFTNNSSSPLRLTSQQITLANASGELLSPISAEQIVNDHQQRAATLKKKAEQQLREEEISAREQARDRERQKRKPEEELDAADKTGITLDAISSLLSVGDSKGTRLSKEAEAAQVEAALINETVKQTPFFATEIPPGQSLTGILYFEMPTEWPVLLMVRADKTYLAAKFEP